MLVSQLRPADVPEASPSAFRDLVAALGPLDVTRILDVGAGGFVGDVTTRYLLELFPEATVTAVELDPGRADALRERFGDQVEVVTGDIREIPFDEPFDLVALDLDSGAIPLIYEELIDGVIANATHANSVVVTLVMTSHEQAFSGPKAFKSGAEFHAAFMTREFGALELTDDVLKAHFDVNPRYDALVLVDKWRDDPANFIGWLALRRTDAPAMDQQSLADRPRFEALTRLVDTEGTVELEMVGDRSECGPDCEPLISRWSDWARTAFGGCFDGELFGAGASSEAVEIVAPAVPLALLEVPESIEPYHGLIGAKSRNMLRKAARNGYSYAEFDYNAWLDDIFEVNRSKRERQGQPMAQAYLEPPQPSSPHDGCQLHRIVSLGAFREGRLRAYVRLIVLNELAIVNQFLGHGDDLPNGVMNGLVEAIVAFALEDGHVKAVNYLTLHSATDSLDRFKRSVGFSERVALLGILPA